MKKTVGIIGNGFVGESTAFAFSPTNDVKIYDINSLRSTHTIEEVHNCEYVFVCVPTPMDFNGKQDISYIEEVFKYANNKSIYIIKSTILPGTTERLIGENPKLKIIFSPEFLTERTAKLDMLTQSRIILGGELELTKQVEKLFNERFMNRHIIHTDSKTAEFIKYMNNTFFATKVSIMNEFYRLSNVLDINWKDALYGFASDGRVGDSHLHVPGPDGKLGFGGSCFPKDINALINLCGELDIPARTLLGAWITNLNVRPEQDWKELKGRAVTDE